MITAANNPFTKAEIERATIQLADVPAGFAQGAPSTTSAVSTVCGETPLEQVAAVSQTDVVFRTPTTGSVISERMDAFLNNTVAGRFFVVLRSDLKCQSVTAVPPLPPTSPDSQLVTADQFGQWRVTGVAGTQDVVWVQQGSLIVQTCISGPAASNDLVDQIANDAVVRLKQALA